LSMPMQKLENKYLTTVEIPGAPKKVVWL